MEKQMIINKEKLTLRILLLSAVFLIGFGYTSGLQASELVVVNDEGSAQVPNKISNNDPVEPVQKKDTIKDTIIDAVKRQWVIFVIGGALCTASLFWNLRKQ